MGMNQRTSGLFGASVLAVSVLFASGRAAPGEAQHIQTPPNRGGVTTSMGLPPTWRFSLGGTTGLY